jgi:hypothetical protein
LIYAAEWNLFVRDSELSGIARELERGDRGLGSTLSAGDIATLVARVTEGTSHSQLLFAKARF